MSMKQQFQPDLSVVHVIPVLSVGGIWRFLHSTLQHSALGDRHTIVALFAWPSDFARQTIDGSFESLEIDKSEFGNRSAIILRLSEVLQRLCPHIVHSHHFYSDIYAIPAARSLKIPVVRSVHGITQIDPGNTDGERIPRFDWSAEEIAEEARLEGHVSKTIVVSHDLKRRMEFHGFASNKLEIVYPGVDSGTFSGQVAHPSPDLLRVGFIGRLEPVKNPELIPLIAQQMEATGHSAEFTVVGEGRLRNKLDNDIRERALNNIQILRETQDVAAAMRTFDVLVVPSLSEGVPHVILEAMASRVPVVASRVGGIPEVIEDRVTGHLCSSGDVKGFASRLIECWRGRSATLAMIERASLQVTSKFEARGQYARLKTLYASIIASS